MEEIALTQRKKMHKLLVSFDDRWETILNRLERASFTTASMINGEGCEANPLEGCYWYSEAASQGHAKAMMNLAICYRNGTGVLQSGIKMMEWYAKAAYCLLPEAVYNLGLSLKHEEVIRGNTELGTTLINASEDVEDYSATQGFVKKVAEMILEALEQFRADNEGGSV